MVDMRVASQVLKCTGSLACTPWRHLDGDAQSEGERSLRFLVPISKIQIPIPSSGNGREMENFEYHGYLSASFFRSLFLALQQNLWVNFGSGRSPIV